MSIPAAKANRAAPVAEVTSLAQRRYLAHLTELDRAVADVLRELPAASDEQLSQMRASARRLGQAAWRVECAVDFEIIERATRVKRGRGNVDTEGRGVVRRVEQRARALGVTPNTVWRNARVHRLSVERQLADDEAQYVDAENSISANTVLREKGYYLAALDAHAPIEALGKFATQKAEAARRGARFRVSDAVRIVEREQEGYRAPTARPRPERAQVVAHIDRTLQLVRGTVIPDCPDKKLEHRIYDEFIAELEDYRAELTADATTDRE